MRMRIGGQAASVLVVWASLFAMARGQPANDGDNPFKDVPPVDLTKITPAEFAGPQKKVKLPSPLTDIVAAANGRYLIMHLKRVRQLAVFDVSKAALVKLIPLGADDVCFAAGAEKLIVFLHEQKILQRWSLKTFERELTVTSPTEDRIHDMVMGSASDGPALLVVQGVRSFFTIKALDTHSLKLLDLQPSGGKEVQLHSVGFPYARASADGRVFSIYSSIVQLTDTKMAVSRYGGQDRFALPNSDGSVLYSLHGLFTPDMQPITREPIKHLPIPAAQPGYYLTLPVRSPNATGIERSRDVGLHIEGDQRRLVTLEDIKVTQSMPSDGRYETGMMLDKRFWYIPDAKLLVQVPIANDHLILHRVDIDRLLEQSEADYLFVTSRAPATAALGKPFEYQVVARSKKGGVKYELSSGPAGMKIDEAGKLTWSVPADFSEVRQQIIIAVRDDSGQETFHTFAVRLPEAEANAKKKAAAELARATKEREETMAKARVEQDRRLIAELALRGPAALEKAKQYSAEVMRRYEQQQNRKPPHPIRSWIDSDGNLIEARLTEIFAGFANLQSTTGQMFLAPISRLSEEDQAYVKKISETAIAERKKTEAATKEVKSSVPLLKLVGLAMTSVTQQTKYYPPAYSASPDGKRLLSWRVHVLPYIGAGDLYNLFKKDEPWDSRYNKELLAYMPPFYRASGSEAGPGKTNFLAVRGKRSVIVPPAVLGDGSVRFLVDSRVVGTPTGPSVSVASITDGTAHTAMVVEFPTRWPSSGLDPTIGNMKMRTRSRSSSASAKAVSIPSWPMAV